MPNTTIRQSPTWCDRLRLAGLRVVAGAIVTVLIVACNTSDLLSVKAPNSVSASLYGDPANATLMVNSVIGDFECALGSVVMAEALATDEMHDATYVNRHWNLDRRDNGVSSGLYGTADCFSTTGGYSLGVYTPLSTARQEADTAIASLKGWTDAQVPNRTALLAKAEVYAGFTYAYMGMAMCQAAFDKGPLVDQSGMFALAESRFTDAIADAQTAGLTDMLTAAYAGRARVRLFQHNTTGAIADAQLVPAGFVFNATSDAANPRRYNHIYSTISTSGSATVEESTRNLTTENGEIDPRSASVQLSTPSGDGLQVIFIPVKYNAASLAEGNSIPTPIARYEEAQLIIAEAEGGTQAVAIINTLRTAVGLSPYTGPTDPASITNLIASERQRVLFFEGFRAFDIERFNLPLVPAIGAPYIQGGVYGATVCFPVPDIERNNNPNIDASQIISGVQGEVTPP